MQRQKLNSALQVSECASLTNICSRFVNELRQGRSSVSER
jgi:hypothetical protein